MTEAWSYICFQKISFQHPERKDHPTPEFPEWFFHPKKHSTFFSQMHVFYSSSHSGVSYGMVIHLPRLTTDATH